LERTNALVQLIDRELAAIAEQDADFRHEKGSLLKLRRESIKAAAAAQERTHRFYWAATVSAHAADTSISAPNRRSTRDRSSFRTAVKVVLLGAVIAASAYSSAVYSEGN
jgi:hypothetical protein